MYLVAQVKAGAQMLQVFESHAEYLGKDMFDEFALPYLRQIAQKVKVKLADQGLDIVPMVSQKIRQICIFTNNFYLIFRLFLPKVVTTP